MLSLRAAQSSGYSMPCRTMLLILWRECFGTQDLLPFVSTLRTDLVVYGIPHAARRVDLLISCQKCSNTRVLIFHTFLARTRIPGPFLRPPAMPKQGNSTTALRSEHPILVTSFSLARSAISTEHLFCPPGSLHASSEEAVPIFFGDLMERSQESTIESSAHTLRLVQIFRVVDRVYAADRAR